MEPLTPQPEEPRVDEQTVTVTLSVSVPAGEVPRAVTALASALSGLLHGGTEGEHPLTVRSAHLSSYADSEEEK